MNFTASIIACLAGSRVSNPVACRAFLPRLNKLQAGNPAVYVESLGFQPSGTSTMLFLCLSLINFKQEREAQPAHRPTLARSFGTNTLEL